MGHDIHFLERLPQRVDDATMHVAMALYRDAELVKLLVEAELPGDSDAGAICLDPAGEGPFLIVGRDGHFRTCLARGMKPKDTVISHARLSHHVRMTTRIRDRLALARERFGTDDLHHLLRRVETAGHRLSREEFLAASAWSSVVGTRFFLRAIHHGEAVGTWRKTEMRRWVSDRPEKRAAMEELWCNVWSTGHLTVLGLLDGMPEHFLETFEESNTGGDIIAWPAAREGLLGNGARAFWAVGRCGKDLLPSLKLALARARTDLQTINIVCSLVAIAIAHPKYAAEIRKVLDRPLTNLLDISRPAAESTLNFGRLALADPAEFAAFTREGLVAGFHALSPDAPPPSDELAVGLALHDHGMNYGRYRQFVPTLVGLVTITALRSAEELYLPQALVEELVPAWKPTMSLEYAAEVAVTRAVPKPVVAAATPGRNEPCSCGSGKKFKKCCGA